MSRHRITVADHEAFRASLLNHRIYDEVDEAMADPIRDRPHAKRGKHESENVLRILDELNQEDHRG